jgi:uncharacterized protein YoaH (UPF0181 family)
VVREAPEHDFMVQGAQLCRAGARPKAMRRGLSAGEACQLIAETATDGRTKADPSLNRIWRNDEDSNAILLHITDASLTAIGVAPESGDSALTGADEAPCAEAPQDASAETDPVPKLRTQRSGTKQAKLIEMLRTSATATESDW